MSYFNVIIVGTGLSGIGAACHLQRQCPEKTIVLLESRDALGGTWDLFRYPGVRSDSDMHTLGYEFKPWLAAKTIADGPSILEYLREAASENGVTDHIRFGHRVSAAKWCSDDASWHLAVAQANEESRQFSCQFLFMCGGYYNYDEAHNARLESLSAFKGQVVHPQFWPDELDYSGKRVVVIGSGATAMTLVPAMARKAAHVTMLQRSPTYVVSMPAEDAIANTLQRWLPDSWAYALTRWKNVFRDLHFYRQTRIKPAKIKADLIAGVRAALGPNYDIEKHFTPTYNPWDQRLCLIPDDDLFDSINTGDAEVVTDRIDDFTENGVALQSGKHLQADIIVTATGLKLSIVSDVSFSVDGQSVKFPETYSYKGMMFSDVPNVVQTFGYINASWTLRADLTAGYFCRLINRMDELHVRQCTPRLRDSDSDMRPRPWIEDFPAGYIQRAMDMLPKQGDRAPWIHTQDYTKDKKQIRRAPIDDDVLVFS